MKRLSLSACFSILSWLSSSLIRRQARRMRGKRGTTRKGMVAALPVPEDVIGTLWSLLPGARDVFAGLVDCLAIDPTSVYFRGLPSAESWQGDLVSELVERASQLQERLDRLLRDATHAYARAIGVTAEAEAFVQNTVEQMHRHAPHDAFDVARFLSPRLP